MSINNLLVSVVLAEKNIQFLHESRDILEPSAQKIKDISADLRDVKLETVILDLPYEWEKEKGKWPKVRVKVIIKGILHKQIFWVGKNNATYHKEKNERFSTFVLFTEKDIAEYGKKWGKSSLNEEFYFKKDKINGEIWIKEVEANLSHLISPNRLDEKTLIDFTLKLIQLGSGYWDESPY